jgi:Holliday junction resolvase RusA-like endonuclease
VTVLEVHVAGLVDPAPQGSKRIGRNRTTGRPIILDDNDVTKAAWRREVTRAAAAARRGTHHRADPAGTPQAVTIEFLFTRPAKHYGTGRNAGVLKPNAPRVHTTKPDVDKVTRAVLDSLTDAGVWADDSQVQLRGVVKLYADDKLGAGVHITVETMCRSCGCTDLEACTTDVTSWRSVDPLRRETCTWTEPGLCSTCA